MATVKNITVVFGQFVNFEAKVLTAARDEVKGLNQVHVHGDGSITRLNQQYFCSGCNTVVPYPQIQKGLDTGNGFVIINPADLDACKAPSSQEVNITKFVPINGIDPIFLEKSFVLVHEPKKAGAKNAATYELLYQILKDRQLAGVATIEIKGKFHNCIIRPYGKGLALYTIFASNEVRIVPEYEVGRPGVELNSAYVPLINGLIDTMLTDFDPTAVTDPCFEKYSALIATASKGAAAPAAGATAAPKPAAPPVDPMLAALQASLAAANAQKNAKAKSSNV